MRREIPEQPLWHDRLFARSDYRQSAREVELSLINVEAPDEVRLRDAMPDVLNQLKLIREDIVRSVDHHGQRNYTLQESTHRGVHDFLSGHFIITIHGPQAVSAKDELRASPAVSASVPNIVSREVGETSRVRKGVQSSQPSYGAQASHETYFDAFEVLCPLDPAASPPQVKMARSIHTVPDLWREWQYGSGSDPAIQALEDAYGAGWRLDQAERVFFGRRKVIIDEVKRRAALPGATPAAAVEDLELVRRRMKVTLHRLWRWLHDKKDAV